VKYTAFTSRKGRAITARLIVRRVRDPNRRAAAWNWAARRNWLSHQAMYDSGPYEQAARVFRQHGYASGAEQILIARRRQAYHGTGSTQHVIRRAIDRSRVGSEPKAFRELAGGIGVGSRWDVSIVGVVAALRS
jgi:hypothetical protein